MSCRVYYKTHFKSNTCLEMDNIKIKVGAVSKMNISHEQRSREKAFHRHNFADNQSQVLIHFYQSTF